MPLKSLFIDLNAYFASVEQQVQPELRGKPVAVTPIVADSGCCIAVSYEAKKFGVKTGTRVREARELCPQIQFVDARPRLYLLMHHRVLKAIDTVMPVHKVHSIDEMLCRLDATQRTRERAERCALELKRAIIRNCGECMRTSIGIAPNRVLAKLGTDLMKPDGLVILDDADLPGKIEHLSPEELTGIGARTMKRLEAQGIRTIGDLLKRDEQQMEHLWGGIVGRYWWHWLRGGEVFERPTRKSSIGHQHVLAPDIRHNEGARSVAFRLLLKAAARLRHDGYAARTLTLGMGFWARGQPPIASAWGGSSWSVSAALGEGCVDTPSMLDALGSLWERVPRDATPSFVGVTLHDLVAPGSLSLPLFREENKRTNLSRAMDAVNSKFGANAVYTANMHDARDSGSGGIAFTYVPDLSVTDSVKDRMRGGARSMSDGELDGLIEGSLR